MSVVSRAENLQQTSTHTNERRKARNERSQEETRTEANTRHLQCRSDSWHDVRKSEAQAEHDTRNRHSQEASFKHGEQRDETSKVVDLWLMKPAVALVSSSSVDNGRTVVSKNEVVRGGGEGGGGGCGRLSSW